MARESEILMYRGEDVVLNFAIKASDAEDASAQNITGWTLSFTVSRRENSETKIIETKSAVITTAASGLCTVTLGAAETEDATPATYFWDLWRTNAGSMRQLCYGDFVISPAARLPEAPA